MNLYSFLQNNKEENDNLKQNGIDYTKKELSDSQVWGPHFWYFLHSLAHFYPKKPNKFIQKKYFNLINDFHIFIPNSKMSEYFQELIEKYPVNSYLESRELFEQWTYFIHLQVNLLLGKEKKSINFYKKMFFNEFDIHYMKSENYISFNINKKYIIFFVIIILLCIAYYLSNKSFY